MGGCLSSHGVYRYAPAAETFIPPSVSHPAVPQSTDKNFMVPVGGAVVCAPASRPGLVGAVNGTYPGRASSSSHVDLMMTLLHWGAAGWRKVRW